MDLNKGIRIGKFRDTGDGKIFYYPILKTIRKDTWMLWVWCGKEPFEISGDSFVLSGKELELLEVIKLGK